MYKNFDLLNKYFPDINNLKLEKINKLYEIYKKLNKNVNLISRKNEFAADTFSKETTNDPESLVSGLKKLSVESLSNLTPIRFKVIMDYSHPPVIERIKALREK